MGRSVETAVACAAPIAGEDGVVGNMAARRKNLSHGSQVAVVYRDAPLTGATIEVSGKALVNLVAAVLPDRPATDALLGLRPDTVVVGPEATALTESFVQSAIFCPKPGRGSISIVIHLADAIVVVRCRRLVMDWIVDSWIESVAGGIDGSQAASEDVA